MPLPGAFARFNRRFSNHLTRPFARLLPGFAVLEHVGRNTGRVYETPLNAWLRGDTVYVALIYGQGVDWLRNARAGTSEMTLKKKRFPVGTPFEVDRDLASGMIPGPVMRVLDAMGVDSFIGFPVLSRPS